MSTTTSNTTGREKWTILAAYGYACNECGTAYDLRAISGVALCATCNLTTRKR